MNRFKGKKGMIILALLICMLLCYYFYLSNKYSIMVYSWFICYLPFCKASKQIDFITNILILFYYSFLIMDFWHRLEDFYIWTIIVF